MHMYALNKVIAGAGAVVALASAAPASAQYYDYRYNRDRDVIEEVVDGVARVAGAVAAVTRGGYYDPRYGSRYDPRYGQGYGYARSGDRFAADACAYEAQRRYARRYGGVGVDIRDVQYYRSNRLRVYGTLELADYGRSDRYDRYNRYDRDARFGRYERRLGFTCTVRTDGRVTDFDTQRHY
jgi:hypothetical protein